MTRQRLFAPLKPSSLSGSIAASITEAILSGKIRPGEKLNETQLASEFNVSRTPIREALQELQEHGLLEGRPGRGVSVVRLEQDDVQKINSLRVLLEAEALHLCREKLNAPGEKKLIQLVERMESMEPEPMPQVVLLDLRFHEAIWEQTGNQYLSRILKSLATPLFAHAVTSRSDRGQNRLVLSSHRPLLEFVQGRRDESPEKIILAHIRLSWTEVAPFSRRRISLQRNEAETANAASLEVQGEP